MNVFRLTSFRLDRVLLVFALIPSVLVKSTVGEALVLHQQGVGRAHLHFMGSGDVLSAAAGSSRFGHTPNPKLALQSASQHVRILAVVAIGSVFVPTPHGEDTTEAGLFSTQHCPSFSMAQPQEPPVVDSPSVFFPTRLGRTASTVLLLRNHILLV